jgi:hypothetical protein
MLHRRFSGRKQQVGCVIHEYSIYLLGHLPIEGPQTCLKMNQWFGSLACHNCSSQRGVGIPINNDSVWGQPREFGIQSLNHPTGLDRMTPGTHCQIHGGFWDSEFIKKHVGHSSVIVLTRMHYHVLQIAGKEFIRYWF